MSIFGDSAYGADHEFCDHDERDDGCQCVQCKACRDGRCRFRCAAKWADKRERAARERAGKCKGLLEELKQQELPPDQIAFLEAEGLGKTVEAIRSERKARQERVQNRGRRVAR